MKLAALTSGGKDSLFAAYIMHSQGFEIRYLVTLLPRSEESYMFHRPNAWLTVYQAAAMGIPLVRRATKGEPEAEVEDLREALRSVRDKIQGVVSGALASEYQKQRIDVVCEELGLVSFAPLWHKDPEKLLKEMLSAGFEVIITSAAAEGLSKDWLGRKLTKSCIENLKKLGEKHGLHLAGEGGEYETLVLDMPLFSHKLEILGARTTWNGTSGSYVVEDLKMVKKVMK
jgi:ABC transporter with metal-binding/Fe-S-binding domain ATP-binding protein